MPEHSVSTPRRVTGALTPFNIGLALIALLALGIRVVFVAVKQSHVRLGGDAGYYFMQAQAFAAGKGFIQPYVGLVNGQPLPGADHPPGFVALLAVFFKLGINTPNGQRYALCVIGTVSVVVIGLLGRRIIGARFGLIAAFIAAVYPQVWINDGMLMSETLYVIGLVFSLYCVYSIWQGPTWRNVVGASVAITVACSARPESVLLFVFMLVPVVMARRQVSLSTRIKFLAVSAVIPILLFMPWIVYNQGRFAEPVYLSTGMGQTLLAANCDSTYSGTFMGSYNGLCLTREYGGPGMGPDGSINDVKYRKAAWAYMMNHKRELPKVILAREGRMWAVWRTNQQYHLDGWIEGRGSLVISKWAQFSYWIVAGLGLLGIYAWRKFGVPLYPLVVQFGITAFVAAMTFGVTRYRAGAEIAFVLLAAATIEFVIRKVRDRRTLSSDEPVRSVQAQNGK